jgi:hypothetical protein
MKYTYIAFQSPFLSSISLNKPLPFATVVSNVNVAWIQERSSYLSTIPRDIPEVQEHLPGAAGIKSASPSIFRAAI